jgi:hypothetical protein
MDGRARRAIGRRPCRGWIVGVSVLRGGILRVFGVFWEEIVSHDLCTDYRLF